MFNLFLYGMSESYITVFYCNKKQLSWLRHIAVSSVSNNYNYSGCHEQGSVCKASKMYHCLLILLYYIKEYSKN